MKTLTPPRKNSCLAVADGSWPAWLKAGSLLLMASLCLARSVQDQTSITQNNLIQNGGLDSRSTGWSTAAGGAYFYNATVGSETDSILSIGWYGLLRLRQHVEHVGV